MGHSGGEETSTRKQCILNSQLHLQCLPSGMLAAPLFYHFQLIIFLLDIKHGSRRGVKQFCSVVHDLIWHKKLTTSTYCCFTLNMTFYISGYPSCPSPQKPLLILVFIYPDTIHTSPYHSFVPIFGFTFALFYTQDTHFKNKSIWNVLCPATVKISNILPSSSSLP